MIGPTYALGDAVPAFTVAGEAVATMDDDGTDVRVDLAEPLFIDDVRTLVEGDRVRVPPYSEWCDHPMPDGWVCSRTKGHDPHDYPHTAASGPGHNGEGVVHSVAPPEDQRTDKERALSSEVARLERLAESLQSQMAALRAERESLGDRIMHYVRRYGWDNGNGPTCFEGTNEFLRNFGFPEMERNFNVKFVVEIDASGVDEDTVNDDVESQLTSALSGTEFRVYEHYSTYSADD